MRVTTRRHRAANAVDRIPSFTTTREIWARRGALMQIFLRDLRGRYRPARLGVLWTFARPMIVALLLAFSLGEVMGRHGEDRKLYALQTMLALVPFGLFQQAYSTGANALFANASIIMRSSGPKIFFILSAVSVATVDALICAGLTSIVVIAFGVVNVDTLANLLASMAIAGSIGLGAALMTAALAPRHRDFLFAVPTVNQLSFYVSPVAFSFADLGEDIQAIVRFNPLAGPLELARSAVSVTPIATLEDLVLQSVVVALLLVVFGLVLFSKKQGRIADVL